MNANIEAAIAICGYNFANGLHLLNEALQAPGSTVANGNKTLASYGDRVVALVIAKDGYLTGLSKGAINDSISQRTNNSRLQAVCQTSGLVNCIKTSPSTFGVVPPKTAADSVEAVVAAAFECGGMNAAKTVMQNLGII